MEDRGRTYGYDCFVCVIVTQDLWVVECLKSVSALTLLVVAWLNCVIGRHKH